MGQFNDLTGMKFGRLTVIERDSDYISPKGYHSTAWKCRCDCGSTATVRAIYLKNGAVRSCGCLRAEHPNHTTHGKSNTRLYTIWKGILTRCYNKNDPAYAGYGGRGIHMCDEWRENFEAFYMWSINNGYRDNLTIDRIDNKMGYSPDNCRWATNKVQQNNKGNNRLITYAGKTMTLAQWAEETGIGYHKLKDRINKCKWNIERALTTP